MPHHKTVLYAVLLILATRAQADQILFTQLEGTIQGLWGSQTNADPERNFRSFDNFILTHDSTIAKVRWRGVLDEGLISDGLTPVGVENVLGFSITFYATDAGSGLPGAVLSDQFVPSLEILHTNPGSTSGTFAADLPLGVSILAGVETWFSVAAVLDEPNGAVLLWNSISHPNGDSLSAFDTDAAGSGGEVGFRSFDMAFELRGVPVPGTLPVLGLGIVAALRPHRRQTATRVCHPA